MDDHQVEQALKELKKRIPVNMELKQRLGKAFKRRQRQRTLQKWGLAAALLLLAGTFMLQGPGGLQTVQAQELHVQNQISFIDIGSGSPLGVSEYKGTVYLPVAGKGLFAYDQSGFHQLLQQEVNEAKINQDGSKLILQTGGTLGVYDVAQKKYTELLKGDGSAVFYEQPSWKDHQTILYVKKVLEQQEHGFTVKESGIYEMTLDSLAPTKLGDGASPSYVNGEKAIVFEKTADTRSEVVFKDLASGQESVIDEGRNPAVSPNGKYIAYITSENNRRELQSHVYAEDTVDQIRISDIDGKTKRVVTSNTPNRQIHEQDLPKGLTPGDTPQVLKVTGLYSYYHPVWSSDSQSLFALKSKNSEGSTMSVMRIDFSKKALQEEETVRAFNQAKILRDLDFARSLLKDHQDFLIVSNPHQVSYTITGSGTENNRPYVDVEEHWAYTANPYYSFSHVRYYLTPKEQGYLIDETKDLPGGGSILQQPDGFIVMEKDDGSKKRLFSADTLPNELRPEGNFRISSLAYLSKQNQVIFSLQVLQDPGIGQASSVKVVTYDIANGTFKLLEHVTAMNGMKNVGVEGIIVSPDGRYAALDLFSDDDKQFQSHVLLLDIEQGTASMLEDALSATKVEGTHTYFWDRNRLHFILTSHGQQMHYQWNAAAQVVELP